MKVKDMLHIAHHISDKVHTTTPATNIKSVSQTLKNKGIGALPVISAGKLVGIISERDIVTKVVSEEHSPQYTLVADIMTADPVTVSMEDDLEHCLDLMEEGRFRHLPVLNNNKLVGMISIRDILVALLREKADLARHFENYIFSKR